MYIITYFTQNSYIHIHNHLFYTKFIYLYGFSNQKVYKNRNNNNANKIILRIEI